VFEFIDAHCRQILVHGVDAGVPGRLAIVGDEKRRLVDAIDIAILRSFPLGAPASKISVLKMSA